MLKNYFKVAIINLRRNFAFSLINILGLALGISLCLVLITIIKDQLTFDTFHPNADRIFRINTEALRKDGSSELYATAPFPLGTEVKSNYSFVENVVQLSDRMRENVSDNTKQLTLDGFFTGPEFFQVFGFDLLYGNKATALEEPNTMVLSEKTAEKFFGNENPVGQTLSIKGVGDFHVSGVIKNPPAKTHLEFDMLISNNNLASLEKEGKELPLTNNWENYYANYIYVLLKDKNQANVLEDQLASIADKQYQNATLETRDKGYRFHLQALNKIVPGPMMSNNLGKALPSQLLWVIGIFAFIVLVSACFNYNSLSTAKSLSRAKEIGVRKVSGAFRSHLITQFLFESVLTSLLAFVLASVLFHFILKPFFMDLSIFRDLNVNLPEDVSLYVLFGGFCCIVGLISGIFPAIYLSSLKPLQSIKNLKAKAGMTKLGFRKVLIVTQFAAALLFVVSLINIYRQMEFMMHADYGLKEDNIINVDLQGNNFLKARQLMEQKSNVVEVSGISHPMGTWSDRTVDVRLKPGDDKVPVRDYSVDEKYITNLGLTLIAGKNFYADLPSNRELFAIVNENFLQKFNLGSPAEAINKPVLLGDSLQVLILGVLKDFHFKPFTYQIEPLLLRYNPNDISQMNIQLTGMDNKKTIAQLTDSWKNIDKAQPLSYTYMKDQLQDSYKQYNDMLSLLEVVAFMAVIVACLGFLGLVILLVRQCIKEVSIRKVLGATVSEISFMFARKFAKLLLLATVIGLPIGILLNSLLMQEFAYRINTIDGYVSGVALIFTVAMLTVGFEIFRSAHTNPAQTLRME